VQQFDPGVSVGGNRLGRLMRYLAIPAVVLMVVGAALLLIRPSFPERRPVVLTVYCVSSATWVTAFAPFLDAATSDDSQHQKARATSARIKSAYERRCTALD
jgi:hypothetical protein